MKKLLLVLEGNVQIVTLVTTDGGKVQYNAVLPHSRLPLLQVLRSYFLSISFPSMDQQLCLRIRTDKFQLYVASNPAYYPRKHRSISSAPTSFYCFVCPFFIYRLILFLLQFFLMCVYFSLSFSDFFQFVLLSSRMQSVPHSLLISFLCLFYFPGFAFFILAYFYYVCFCIIYFFIFISVSLCFEYCVLLNFLLFIFFNFTMI